MDPGRIVIYRSHLESDDTLEDKCTICDDTSGDSVRDFFVNRRRFEVVKCPADGLMRVSPTPGPAYLASIYSKPYFSGKDELVGGSDFYCEDVQTSRAQVRIDELKQFLAGYPKRIHEVGFGTGYLLHQLGQRGHIVSGNDIATVSVNAAVRKGVTNVVQGDLGYAIRSGVLTKADIVLMYDSIEHLPDPRSELNVAYGALVEGGVIAIRYPLTPDEGPRVNLVDHIWHFNRDTMRKLLESVGFDVMEQFDSGAFEGQFATVQGVTAIAQKND